MQWRPNYKKIEDIMDIIGFKQVTHGFALYRKKGGEGRPIRYHVTPSFDGYDIHTDYLKAGKHVIRRNEHIDKNWFYILSSIDKGEIPKITKTFKDKYRFIKLKITN